MEDKCILCNDVIPEGRMVCPACEALGRSWKEPAKKRIKKRHGFLEALRIDLRVYAGRYRVV